MGLSYSGFFEDWEFAIARKLSSEFLARHSWIKGYDLDDLVQECLIRWHLAQDSYQHTKGASQQTYMAQVLRNRLQDILDEQFAEKRTADRLASSLEQPLSDSEETLEDMIPATGAGEAEFSLRFDLERTMTKLSSSQRRLCIFLWQGYSVTEIAAILHKARPTIYDEIKRVKKIFADAGLNEYIS